MAENEVTPVKIGHLYYPRTAPADQLNCLAQRVGPTRFGRSNGGSLFEDSKGIGHWYPDEIARNFRPAPDVGSTWRPKGAGFYIPRIVQSVDENAIRTDRGTFLPGTFLDMFEPDTASIREFPAIQWSARYTGPIANPVKADRARLLEAIDTFAARDEDYLTEALDLNDTIQATIEAHTNRPKCVAVESARTALENAIETYDALPGDEGGIVHASPVVLAVDALIEACLAAR